MARGSSSAMIVKLSLAAAFLCAVIGGRGCEAAVNCNQVVGNLSPCISYVTGPVGGAASSDCCNGVRNLNGLARTTYDRQAVCRCLESLINGSGFSYNANNVANAAALPAKCGVNLPFKISPNVDCSSIRV